MANLSVKRMLLNVDERFVNGRIRWSYQTLRGILENRSERNELAKLQDLSIGVISEFRNFSEGAQLARLCDQFGSDKGSMGQGDHPFPWSPHTYTDVYAKLFETFRSEARLVLEVGIGTNDPTIPSSMGKDGKPGASLRVWKSYFPKAAVYGADVDKSVLFEEAGIQTFHVDQTDALSVQEMWRKIGSEQFDIIIDDGLHTLEAAWVLFNNSIAFVRSGGLYIVEDLKIQAINELIQRIGTDYRFSAFILRDDVQRGLNNNLLVIYK